MRQVKNQAKATATHIEAVAIDAEDFVKSSIQIVQVQVQSHLVCTVDKAYDSDDTNDEKVLSENCNKINMLTVLTEDSCRHERSLKTLNKSKDIMQECIEKEKQYAASKILCCENYINVFRTVKIQNNQETLKSEIILKIDSDILSSQSVINDLESLSTLRNLSISD